MDGYLLHHQTYGQQKIERNEQSLKSWFYIDIMNQGKKNIFIKIMIY